MWIYQAYAVTAGQQSFTGALLATCREEAIGLAVQRCKLQFGEGSRVTRLVAVADAGNIGSVKHAGLHRLLNEFDQLRFCSSHLARIIRRQIEMIAELTALIKSQYGESGNGH